MTILVAEMGINHQGEYEILDSMIRFSLCNTDYAKVQVKTPELSVPQGEWDKPKKTPWRETIPYIEYKKKMEIDPSVIAKHPEIDRIFPSVWDIEALERWKPKSRYIKIPSAKLTDLDLCKKVGKRLDSSQHPILSCGMSTIDQIADAVDHINNDKLILMACVSAYPLNDTQANLGRINTLKRMFPNVTVGYSSHHPDWEVAFLASMVGAEMVEVHFTLSRSMVGTDHKSSLDESGLVSLSQSLKRTKVLMGNGKQEVLECERPAMEKLR